MVGNSRRRKKRVGTRKSQTRVDIPAFVHNAALQFAAQRALPNSDHVRTPMRDLKGWLAGLLRIDALLLWVTSASALCFNLDNPQDFKPRAEHFTRTVLRIILDRDRDRSSSIDTTLRRQCCTDRQKSGLTFMKILVAMCTAFEFSGSTSRCYATSHLGVCSSNVEKWSDKYEHLVAALNDIRICVKNDSASANLVAYLTSPEWGQELAKLLVKDHHSMCLIPPACNFHVRCGMFSGNEEMHTLSTAICEAVVSASPAMPAGVRVPRIFFSNTMENDPLCMASLMMPYNPRVAITLVDKYIGLDQTKFYASRNNGMPIEIHREMRVFEAIRARIANNSQAISEVMAAFAKVFKFNRPPLLWWPQQHEMDQIARLAASQNGVAMTVCGLMIEHMALLGRESNKARALEMYTKSGDNGDIFGLTHAGKILLDGGDGVERDPKKAEAYLLHGANKKIRGALSVLGDLYRGAGEPEIARNDSMAAKMYEAAADLGCAKAARNLAFLVENGYGGVPKDEERAKMLRGKAEEKERRKRIQKAHLTPAYPVSGIPDPDFILACSNGSSGSPSVSTQLTENPPQVLLSQCPGDNHAPMREVERVVVGKRRYRDYNNVEIEPLPRIIMPMPQAMQLLPAAAAAVSPLPVKANNPSDAIDELLEISPAEFDVDAECTSAQVNLFKNFVQCNLATNNQPSVAQHPPQSLQFAQFAIGTECAPKRRRTTNGWI